MKRDLRQTPLYREIEEHYRRALAPAFGTISGGDELAPSPDGRLLAFTGARLDTLEGSPAGRICLLDVETGEVREVTAGPHDDTTPRWSPDGERLAFLSDRRKRGRSQLFLLERDRLGEAAPTPEVDGTVEYLEFSPDGRQLLLGVAQPGADQAGGHGSGRVDDGADLPDWVPQVRLPGWRRLHVHDLAEGTTRVVSPEGMNVWEASWSGPDAMAAIVSDQPGEEAWYEARLVLLDPATGAGRDLHATGRPDRQIGYVAGSPDGGRVALVRAVASDRGFLEGDVLLIDPGTGDVTEVDTAGVDVSALAWRDEGRLLYMGQRHLESVAGEIDVGSGTATEAWTGDAGIGGRATGVQPIPPDGMATVTSSYETPPSIAWIRDGKLESVHSFGHEGTGYLAERAGTLQAVTWTAPDGIEIEGLLAVPDGPGPHALLVHVHGGPMGAYRDTWAMGYPIVPLLVSRGYAVLHPNPRGSTGRGQAFQDMVVGDMGGADADDLLSGVEALIESGVADPSRIGVFGGSYGGFMATWLPSRSDRFAAAVAISPITDWYSQHWTSNIGFWDRVFLEADPGPGGPYFDRSPVMFADRVNTPTLLTAGTEDRCTPSGQAVEFHQALAERGVPSEVVIYPGEGHGVRKLPAAIDAATRLVGWFEEHMPAR